MRVIIIGGIAAGMSAAAKLRRVRQDAKIVIYEKQDYVSFGACGLPYYVGDFFEEHERMIVRTPEQMIKKGIDVRTNHEVIHVDAKLKKITVRNDKTNEMFEDSYDRLMIATGASPIMPPIEGLELTHVSVLRTLQDGLKVKEWLQKEEIKKVVIVGAGFIGLEVVEAVKHMGKEAIVIQLGDRVLKGPFDPEITNQIEQELQDQGVTLHLNTKVVRLEGDSSVRSVITDQGKIDADMVIIATGVRPNTSFLADTGIKMLKNGAIVIDQEGRTSIEDIYAAGDCATIPHYLKEEPAYIPLATTANKLGRIVGENLGGAHITFEGTLGSGCVSHCNLCEDDYHTTWHVRSMLCTIIFKNMGCIKCCW